MQLTCLMRTILYKGTLSISKNLNRKSIMTTPRKLQEILEDLKGNPYYDRYAEKIAKIQQSEPEEFLSRVKKLDNKNPNKIEPAKVRQYSQLLSPKESLKTAVNQGQNKEESLDKIMKVDLIKDKSAEEIKSIWEEYHLGRDCIAATIPSEDFQKIDEFSTKYPTFLFPLPRSQGYEFIMCQFEKNSVHFTPLLYFQVHKENAPECLTITHYKEFQSDKGIVLMRGEYDKNVLNGKEAQCLANQLQMFYVQQDEEKVKLLETFTYHPDKFDHMDLVKQIGELSIS